MDLRRRRYRSIASNDGVPMLELSAISAVVKLLKELFGLITARKKNRRDVFERV